VHFKFTGRRTFAGSFQVKKAAYAPFNKLEAMSGDAILKLGEVPIQQASEL
jgi:hypothetical protein